MKFFIYFLKDVLFRHKKLLVSSCFLFLFLISGVLAVGISPPEVSIDYDGEQKFEAKFKIINSGMRDNVVVIDLYGDIAEYASLSQYQFDFKQGQRFQEVTLVVDMPAYEQLTYFGKQTILMYIKEGQRDATGSLGFLTEVTAKVRVDIPVPGKLGEIKRFYVDNTNKGFGAPITLELANKGTEELVDVRAKVMIEDYAGNTLDTVEFPGIDIDPDDVYSISEVFPTESYDSAIYFATASFVYDEEKVPLKKKYKFFVGSTDISLLNYTPDLVRGKINKVTLGLQSLWGSPLKNIRGTITYAGGSQALPVIDFSEFEQKDIELFLEVPSLEDGVFPATLTLDIPVDETTDTQKVIPLSFTLIDEKKPSSEFPIATTSLLIIGLVITLLILLGVNVHSYINKKKKNSK